MELYFTGLIIGIATFVIIGIFHPLVIKGEVLARVSRNGHRCDRGFDLRGRRAMVDAAGRVGHIVVLEHRRGVRAAKEGRKGVVPETRSET